MPEIKHQFTGGKMNKDLDERLVKNGEYRDAMNVQVATSEGSDVATVQNVLGNKKVPISTKWGNFDFPPESIVVASIADEKVDTLYWFVWTNNGDYIVRFRRNSSSPEFVFIDDKTRIDANGNLKPHVLKFDPSGIITGVNIIDGMIYWTDNHSEPKKINVERCMQGTEDPVNSGSFQHTKLINEPAGMIDPATANTIDIEEKHITVIRKTPPKAMEMEMETFRDPAKVYTAVITVEIDDDAVNSSSLNYTSQQADMYNFSGAAVGDEIAIRIENAILPDNTIGPLGVIYSTTSGMTGWQDGTSGSANIPVGTKLVIKEFDGTDDPPSIPITDYTIKCEVIDAQSGPATVWDTAIYVRITGIDGFPPLPDVAAGQTELQYAVDLFEENEKLFEFKFPRFSYRYKYDDGEYSPFAPFTQVAFKPGAFDYHPRKGYNLGMTNQLKNVKLSRFINKVMPKDVVSVDVLFKDEPSTAIYVVDTIKPDDEIPSGASENKWDHLMNGGQYIIEKETVNNILPENQLLRPWDNVPRKALAQDITGNRVVYANYVQNYNLKSDSNKEYYADFKTNWKQFDVEYGNPTTKSCKSLREYQLGVVFIDKYGRETPVISNATGTMKLDKGDANKANRIQVGLRGAPGVEPGELTYMKFFVKETANEYYNMAMDRWYHAEDSNIWLSFPSSDRNKIDIDSFLILKKGSDTDDLVTDAARYKVLAIENEAPEFIKTVPQLYSEKTHIYPLYDSAGNVLSDGSPIWESDMENAPRQGQKTFKLLYNTYKGSPGRNLHEYKEGELWIDFGHIDEEEKSKRYKITNLSLDDTATDATYNVLLDEPFGADINFICDDSTGISPNFILDGTEINIYKYEPRSLPQFDGRFFVKIYMDDTFRQNIEKSFKSDLEYRIIDQRDVYFMKEKWMEQHTAHMNWWFTSGYQESQRYNDGFMGSRNHDTGSGSVPYGWKMGLGSWYGDILNLLIDGPAQELTHSNVGGTGCSYAGVVSGRACDNVDGSGHIIKYGHYISDKFTSSALWFRRYLPLDDSGGALGGAGGACSGGYWQGTWHSSTSQELNMRWRESTFNGGDKDDPDNWVPVPVDKCDAYFGVGSHFWYVCGPSGSGAGDNNWLWERFNEYNYTSNADVSKDARTWFIDDGRAQGQRTTSHSYAFNTQNDTPIHLNAYNCNKSGVASGPKGYNIYNGGANWLMWLSFGGIYGAGGSGGAGEAGVWDTTKNHWGIGEWNGDPSNTHYSFQQIKDWVSRINPGNRFKFEQDPDNTLYSMSSQITGDKRWLNHSVFAGNAAPSTAGNYGSSRNRKRANGDIMAINMDPCIDFNFRRSWYIRGLTPSLAWNPFETGEIPTGYKLSLTVCDSMGQTSVTSSSITVGDENGPDGTWVKIYVTDLQGEDQNGLWGTRNLHVGMGLKSFTPNSTTTPSYASTLTSTPVTSVRIKDIDNAQGTQGHDASAQYAHAGNDYLVVTKITPMKAGVENTQDPQYYELRLGGYNFPMQNSDHSWLQGSHDHYPQNGSNYVFVQLGVNGHNENTAFNLNACGYEINAKINNQRIGKMGAVGVKIQFVEEIEPEEVLSENPAIWETEPKDAKDLDIYYEATGAIPINFTEETIHEAFPIGTTLVGNSGETYYVWGFDGVTIKISETNNATTLQAGMANLTPLNPVTGTPSGVYKVTTPAGLTFGVVVTSTMNGHRIEIEPRLYNSNFQLPWHNCYSFGNGVESNRIRDNYNQSYILNGVKASTTLDVEYKEEHRKYGLIYSGIYNSTSGVNNLNQFIQAEKITKDINPIYGSIQKLHSRDSDIVTLCEDKILRIQANKDALYNADGSTNVAASDKVLGQTIPFSGEYGISTNPESFASEAYRAYFSDRVRGAIMRLSKDGLTPISNQGMKDWFKDNLKLINDNDLAKNRIIGSYDDRNDEYVVKLETQKITGTSIDTMIPKVLSYSERVKGWISFKSFTEMQLANSMANDYYTFSQGELWKHYDETPNTRNTFYNTFTPSTFDVILNDNPSAVKTFNTLNYEGSQSKIDDFISQTLVIPLQPTTTYNDQEYYNLASKDGWYVEKVITDLEEGYINEFIEKEGKWFNNINKIVDTSLLTADTGDFTFQGIGVISEGATTTGTGNIDCPTPTITLTAGQSPTLVFSLPPPVFLPTIGTYDDYNWTVTSPMGFTWTGGTGTMPSISNTDIINNMQAGTSSGDWSFQVEFIWGLGGDDGDSGTLTSCVSTVGITLIYGCTDATAFNYNGSAQIDDGSCEPIVYGCTDPTMWNYNPNANVDDGTCYEDEQPADDDDVLGPVDDFDTGDGGAVYGCTDPSASNYNPNATIDDGSCIVVIPKSGSASPPPDKGTSTSTSSYTPG